MSITLWTSALTAMTPVPEANLYIDVWRHVYVAGAERVQYASVTPIELLSSPAND